MNVTSYPEVNEVLQDLLERLQASLEENLLALYLYGSLVWGDFDETISDLDMLAVLNQALNEEELTRVEQLHDDLAKTYPRWFNRVEVHYVSKDILADPLAFKGTMTVISPGEPLNQKAASKHYLMNWYLVQEQSKLLFGPEPSSFIAPIAKEAFFNNFQTHVEGWQAWLQEESHAKGLSYATLTMCRALYSLNFAKQASKPKAAAWAAQTYPKWSQLIQKALEYRVLADEDCPEGKTIAEETRAFVAFTLIEAKRLTKQL